MAASLGPMLANATDYAGIAAVIAAVFSGLATLIGAYNGRTARRVQAAVTTPNGAPPLAEAVTNVAAAVTTPEGTPTLGETVAHVHEQLDGNGAGETPTAR